MSLRRNLAEFKIKATFISHFAEKFKEIRKLDGVTDSIILESLSLEANRRAIFKAGESSGKSGSFFFFSADNKFLIKTISVKERKELIKLLDPLIDHFNQTQGCSLLARIYGLFTLKSRVFSPVDIILMQNTSVLLSQSHTTIAFDLKGSTFNR